MRQYETAFLIAPNLPEEDNEKLIAQMADVVSKKKGNMINVDEWGKRKLAYPIQKHEEAYYVFFLYEGDPAIPAELERRFKQTETIIRYLTVKNEITESAKKGGRAPTRKKREAAAVKEEKAPKSKDVSEEKPVKDLGVEPKEMLDEKQIEESIEIPKPEPEKTPEKEAKVDLDKEPKAKAKEKPKTEPAEEQKEAKSLEIETESKEKPKEKAKEDSGTESKTEPKTERKTEAKAEHKADPKAEPEAEAKTEPKAKPEDKTEEKAQEKLPPEDKEKKEK
jgi:small subunit ribosomal protein S6